MQILKCHQAYLYPESKVFFEDSSFAQCKERILNKIIKAIMIPSKD